MAWWCWTTRFSRAKDTELWGRKEAWQSAVKTFFMAFGAYWCFWEWKQVRLDYLKCVEWHFEKNWEQLLSPMIFGPKTPGSPVISTSIDACVATANELAKAKITFAKRNILLSSGKSCITKSTKNGLRTASILWLFLLSSQHRGRWRQWNPHLTPSQKDPRCCMSSRKFNTNIMFCLHATNLKKNITKAWFQNTILWPMVKFIEQNKGIVQKPHNENTRTETTKKSIGVETCGNRWKWQTGSATKKNTPFGWHNQKTRITRKKQQVNKISQTQEKHKTNKSGNSQRQWQHVGETCQEPYLIFGICPKPPLEACAEHSQSLPKHFWTHKMLGCC